MATPAEIAAGASCFACISNKQEALLYLLAQIAGVTDPAIISANASCFACIPNKQEAILYLLDAIATASSGGSGGFVLCGSGAPVAAPAGGCSVYIDTDTDALYIYRLGAWSLKV